MVKADNIVKSFYDGEGKVEVIQNISLEILKGEFVAILGSSGAGKSTLLYILSGILKPDSGSVYIDDKEIYKLKDNQMSKLRRESIGFIFQSYNIIEEISVEDNIKIPLILNSKKIKEQEIDNVLQKVGLENKKNKSCMQLSGGEKQRVAIARAMITKPKVLFADEPTGNLDSKNTEMIMECLSCLNKEYHTSIIMVTHDEMTLKHCNKVINIKDGKIMGKLLDTGGLGC